MKLIEDIRANNPLIHNITNIVVANDSANGLLALGASPFMSSALGEMLEVAAIANATVLNLGTITDELYEAMVIVGQEMNRLGKVVVVDPVGCGATTYRKKTTEALLQTVRPTLIRGNAGEIASLAEVPWGSKGVDSGEGDGDLGEIARIVARKYQCLVALSGSTDVITDGDTTYQLTNGTPYFEKMTGAGCLLSCVCGAFLSQETSVESLLFACGMYAICGEQIANGLPQVQVGTFRKELLDRLSVVTSQEVEALIRYQKESSSTTVG